MIETIGTVISVFSALMIYRPAFANIPQWVDRLGGVVVMRSASGAGCRVFNPRRGHTKDFKNDSMAAAHWHSGLGISITTDLLVTG